MQYATGSNGEAKLTAAKRFDDVASPLVGDWLERWPTLEELQRGHPGTLRRLLQQQNCRSQEMNAQRIAAIQEAVSASQDRAVRRRVC